MQIADSLGGGEGIDGWGRLVYPHTLLNAS